jgi:hypothetical protein
MRKKGTLIHLFGCGIEDIDPWESHWPFQNSRPLHRLSISLNYDFFLFVRILLLTDDSSSSNTHNISIECQLFDYYKSCQCTLKATELTAINDIL